MSYSIVTIRTAEHDDPSFYPVLGIAPELIEFEPRDGGQIERLVATAVGIYENRDGKLVRLMSVRDVKIQVFITDSRLAIACEKWDKGGGWRGWGAGGVAVAIALNAASHARAAARRRGKLLVGHVRYQWIQQVGFTSKTDWKSTERVRVCVKDGSSGTNRSLILDLTFPKGVRAQEIANRIAKRGAHYRLLHDQEMEIAEREAFEVLSHTEVLDPVPGSFVFHTFPTSFTANAATVEPPHGTAKPIAAGAGTAVEAPELPRTSSRELEPTGYPEPTGDAAKTSSALATQDLEVLTCPACGATSTGRAFCTACGAARVATTTTEPTEPQAAAPKFCAACGAPSHPGRRFCAKCGTRC
jgi:hypothetical protein